MAAALTGVAGGPHPYNSGIDQFGRQAKGVADVTEPQPRRV